jgi:hypothetical protein
MAIFKPPENPITDAEIEDMVGRSDFAFEIDISEDQNPIQYEQTHRSAGDGVDDIDKVLQYFDRYPRVIVGVDVGQIASSFRRVSRADVVRIRVAYVARFGETAKPNVYIPISPGG